MKAPLSTGAMIAMMTERMTNLRTGRLRATAVKPIAPRIKKLRPQPSSIPNKTTNTVLSFDSRKMKIRNCVSSAINAVMP